MNGILVGVLVYVLIQLGIGVVVSRQVRSEADYLVAGRRLGLVLASFSIFATWFGAETVVGSAGEVYEHGLSGGSADPFGYVLCILIMGALFAVPLWRRGFITFGDLFRERYSPRVEQLAVLLLIPPSVIWAGAQIRAFGQVLSAISSLEVKVAIAAATAVVIVYTAMGGLLADAWTDFVQGIALILGLLVMSVVFVVHTPLVEILASVPAERLSLLGPPDVPWHQVLEDWAVPICGAVFAIELISRILACRTAQTARRACMLGGGIYLLVGLIPVAIGLAGPNLRPGLDEPEQVIPILAKTYLGTFFYVLLAGALISAILSTVDSALLAASALFSHNMLPRLWPGMTDRAKLVAARLGVVALGLVAYGLALQSKSIHDLVEVATAFGSAGIFVVACFGITTPFGSSTSAIAALLTGMAVWVLGQFAYAWPAPYVTAVLASTAAYVVTAIPGLLLSSDRQRETGTVPADT